MILTLFTELNILLAPNKTFCPTQVLEFMGITLDCVQMQAWLPEDKLIRTRTRLSTWSSKRACVLCDLQSLIGSLQFACKVISPGRPFMQHIINLTHNVSEPGQLIYLNSEFRKDVVMWQLRLDHWNGVSLLFLPPPPHPPSPNNPLTSIFIPMLQVLLALEPFLIISGFKVHGFQGPVPQKPINANLRLKINQAVYFSTPKCCSTQIFSRTLHEKMSILKNKNKQKELSPKS